MTISSAGINYKSETTTTADGECRFADLIPGDYEITIEATNFRTLSLRDVRVELGKTADVPAQLQIGVASETVNISAGGAELVETTTTQLSKSFSERQVVELAQTNVGGAFGGGVNNLALLAPGVTSSGGVGCLAAAAGVRSVQDFRWLMITSSIICTSCPCRRRRIRRVTPT